MSAEAKSSHDFKGLRISAGYDLRSFALAIGIPYRTAQSYEYGRKMPAKTAERVLAFLTRDRETMAGIKAAIAARIERDFQGRTILSDPDPEWSEE